MLHIARDAGGAGAVAEVLGSTGRIRYTSVAACETHLACGATTGGVYCFTRAELKFVQIIQPLREGNAVAVQFSRDGECLAVACSKAVTVWEHNLSNFREKAKRLKLYEHARGGITCVQWNERGDRIFVGDDQGSIVCVHVPLRKGLLAKSSKVLAQAKARFMADGETVCRTESKILQMDFADELLLASTLTRVQVFSPARQQFWNVGTKPRDGVFGACFGVRGQDGTVPVFAARPGSRLWRGNSMDGTVQATLNLQQGLNVPSTVLLASLDAPAMAGPASVNFGHLQMLSDTLLLTWQEGRIIVLNVDTATVVGWLGPFPAIRSIACYHQDIFILHEEAPVLTRLRHADPGEAACILANRGFLPEAVQLLSRLFASASPRDFCLAVPRGLLEQLTSASSLPSDQSTMVQDMRQTVLPVYQQLGAEADAADMSVHSSGDSITVVSMGRSGSISRISIGSFSESPLEDGAQLTARPTVPAPVRQAEVKTAEPTMPATIRQADVKTAEPTADGDEDLLQFCHEPPPAQPSLPTGKGENSDLASTPLQKDRSSTLVVSLDLTSTAVATSSIAADDDLVMSVSRKKKDKEKRLKKKKKTTEIAPFSDAAATMVKKEKSSSSCVLQDADLPFPVSEIIAGPMPFTKLQCTPPARAKIVSVIDLVAATPSTTPPPDLESPQTTSQRSLSEEVSSVPPGGVPLLSGQEGGEWDCAGRDEELPWFKPDCTLVMDDSPAAALENVVSVQATIIAPVLNEATSENEWGVLPNQSPSLGATPGSSCYNSGDEDGEGACTATSLVLACSGEGVPNLKGKKDKSDKKSRKKKTKKPAIVDIMSPPEKPVATVTTATSTAARRLSARSVVSADALPTAQLQPQQAPSLGGRTSSMSALLRPVTSVVTNTIIKLSPRSLSYDADAALPESTTSSLAPSPSTYVAEQSTSLRPKSQRNEIEAFACLLDETLLQICSADESSLHNNVHECLQFFLAALAPLVGHLDWDIVSRASVGVLLATCVNLGVFPPDTTAAEFISTYYSLMDVGLVEETCNRQQHNEILQLLWEEERQRPTMRVLLAALEKKRLDVPGAIEILNASSHCPLSLILTYLPKFLSRDAMATLHWCVRLHPTVLPHNVRAVCDALAEERPRLFFAYLDLIFEGTHTHLAALMTRQQPDLLVEWVKGAMEEPGGPVRAQLFRADAQTMPTACGHQFSWPRQTQLLSLLDGLPLPKDRFLQLFYDYGFWPGVLRLESRRSRRIELAVYLNSLELTTQCCASMVEWRQALQLVLTQPAEYFGNLPIPVLLERAALTCGPTGLLSLVHELGGACEFPELTSLLVRCAQGQRLCVAEKRLTRQMLETVNEYLWSQRTNLVAPQLKMCLDLEANGRLHDQPFVQQTSEGQATLLFSRHAPLPMYLEEPQNHWGVPCSLYASCPVCMLALSSSRVCVFECGHAFHAACVEVQGACRVCFEKHQQAVAS